MGRRGPVVGPSWAVVEPSWSRRGPVVGRRGAVVGPSWNVVGPRSWVVRARGGGWVGVAGIVFYFSTQQPKVRAPWMRPKPRRPTRAAQYTESARRAAEAATPESTHGQSRSVNILLATDGAPQVPALGAPSAAGDVFLSQKGILLGTAHLRDVRVGQLQTQSAPHAGIEIGA